MEQNSTERQLRNAEAVEPTLTPYAANMHQTQFASPRRTASRAARRASCSSPLGLSGLAAVSSFARATAAALPAGYNSTTSGYSSAASQSDWQHVRGYTSSASSGSSGSLSFRSDGSQISPRDFAENPLYEKNTMPKLCVALPAGPPPLSPWSWAMRNGVTTTAAHTVTPAGPAAVCGGVAPSRRDVEAFAKVRHDRREEVTELLMRGLVDVDARDAHGNTLLAAACQGGLKRMCKVLLRQGADINSQNDAGVSPVRWAIASKYVALADYLVSKGAVLDYY